MAEAQNQALGEVLYPPREPYRHGFLEVGSGHSVYFEESGNPLGFPVVFVHGGPGSQSRPVHRRFFDPAFYRVVLFDQRGCGRSVPRGSLADNSTAHLVADMDSLRRYLNIQRWVLFGGSWGSTLSIAYALNYAQHVAGMILRGVFLGSRQEVNWFLHDVRRIVPEAWAAFAEGSRGGLVDHYIRLVSDPRTEVAFAAAKRWSDYEARVMEPGKMDAAGAASPMDQLAAVKVQLHFLAHEFFLKPDELIDNLWRLPEMPVTIVQGRMDLVCPPMTAFNVARGIAGSRLNLVAQGGHSALQREIAAELCAATRDMQQRLNLEPCAG